MKAFLQANGDHFDFLWNIDSSVGKGGQNVGGSDDLLYIQWYYQLAGGHPLTPPDRKAIYQRVKLGAPCTGLDSDPLVQAIIAHQTALRHPYIDGKISVATGSGHVGGMAYFVLRLGARFADMHKEVWPRIDLIKPCPPPVAASVQRAVPHLPTG